MNINPYYHIGIRKTWFGWWWVYSYIHPRGSHYGPYIVVLAKFRNKDDAIDYQHLVMKRKGIKHAAKTKS